MQGQSIVFADTLNVAGGDRQNVGDNSGEVNIYCLIATYLHTYSYKVDVTG